MKQRNENEWGIVEENVKFNSIEEAGNYIKDLKDKLKRKASAETFPITTATSKERLKYIEYAISLMTKKNLPFTDIRKIIRAKSVLWLVANGYTFYAIANFLKQQGFGNVTIEKIKEVNKEGMKMCKDAISRVKNNNIPILGV